MGEAIAAELEERAALAHSEQLVIDNERMRQEVAALLEARESAMDLQHHVAQPGAPVAEVLVVERPGSPVPSSSTNSRVATTTSSDYKRQQRAAKARRVMREAVKLRLASDASASVHKWSLSGLDLAKFARIALEIAKISAALRTSEFFADLCVPNPLQPQTCNAQLIEN